MTYLFKRFFILTLFFTVRVSAQGYLLPSAHWGGKLVPQFEKSYQIHAQIALFSQFGQFPETETGCDASALSAPYNHIDETIGFNVVTLSRSDFVRQANRFQSTTFSSNSVYFGLTNDATTEFLQNEIIHDNGLGLSDICKVARGKEGKYFIIGYSWEVNHQFSTVEVNNQGKTVLNRLPFFAGAGFNVGTIFQDAYFQAGFSRLQIKSKLFGNIFRASPFKKIGLNASFVSRFGVLYEGIIFNNLAPGYSIYQGSLELAFSLFNYPISFEMIGSYHSGIFLESEFDPQIHASENDIKVLKETFFSFRLKLGSFLFETYNDFAGKKDIGPTYGFKITVDLSSNSWLSRYFISKI